ncbi:MAG: hypothetical protein SOW25_04265 [Helicobacter sp.]|nr:hypothetical protein [Helicobacteraceae bacterium]MDY3113524.1 hypothetical protein [Helicobacter sp.]
MNKIKEFWDKQAYEFSDKIYATSPDLIAFDKLLIINKWRF